MAVEVLEDIITELADKLGVYGAHGEQEACDNPSGLCRMCFESQLRLRIIAALEAERKLYGRLER